MTASPWPSRFLVLRIQMEGSSCGGFDARPNASGVDCASGLREITQASLCVTRLNDLTGQCVSPLVDGVEHRAILSNGTSGFCVSIVPPSESGPHMAKGGEDRYFKRSGSAFYRMEHFDLEDMFGRRQRPLLFLNVHVVPRTGEDPHEEVHFSILNTGRGVARHSGFFCRFEPEVRVVGVQGQLENVSNLNPGSSVISFQIYSVLSIRMESRRQSVMRSFSEFRERSTAGRSGQVVLREHANPFWYGSELNRRRPIRPNQSLRTGTRPVSGVDSDLAGCLGQRRRVVGVA
jgi:hypothetical protein